MRLRQGSIVHRATARRLAPPVILALLIGGVAFAALAAERAADANQRPLATAGKEANVMKIRLHINGRITTATLDDTPSTRDFIALLPLSMKLEDHNATEKIAYLPSKLSTQGAPAGITPRVGDLAYYAPWGNVALFYRDFGYSPGLIRLGRFDSGVEAIDVGGSLNVTIEAVTR